MGTRINLLFPHNLPDWSNRPRILEILARSLPAAHKVAAYWHDNAPGYEPNEAWLAERPFPPPLERDYSRFSGPGPLFVDVNPYAVRVRTGGRWRGFLSIQALRSVHLFAFMSLMNSFQAQTARCFPDCDFLLDAFWDGGDFPTCCEVLDRQFGQAFPLHEFVDPELVRQTERNRSSRQYALETAR